MRFRRCPTTRPAGEHPVRGDDHVRPPGTREGAGLLGRVHDDGIRVVERRLALREEPRCLFVVAVGMPPVDVGRLRRHRRIEVEPDLRDAPGRHEAVELPDDLLRPPDRERRDEEDAAGLVDEADGLRQDADRLALGLVLAPAVRRLHDDVVRVGEHRRVAEDRRASPTEVAREHDRPLGPAGLVGDAEADDGRPEDVPGVEERRVHAGRHLALLAIRDRAEEAERQLGVALGVERLVEFHVDLGRLAPQLVLGVATGRPRAAAGAHVAAARPGDDRGRHVLVVSAGCGSAACPAQRSSPASARSTAAS